MSGLKLRVGVAAALLLGAAWVCADPLGDGYAAFQKKDYKTALKHWTPLAEGGDAQAQFYLNEIYGSGLGVTADPGKAAQWLEQSAKNGFPPAQFNLGNNLHGQGKPEEAVKWWRAASDQGFVQAQYNLAVAYLHGSGIKADREQAIYWFRKAARGGSEAAKGTLAQLKVPLEPIPDGQAGSIATAGGATSGGGAPSEASANTDWVASQPPGNYTLQAMSSPDRNASLEMAQRLSSLGVPVAVISYKRDATITHAVIVGSFPSAAEAAKMQQRLPESLAKGKPWTRSFASVHKVMIR